MRFRRIATTLAAVAVAAGVGSAGWVTRDRWLPHMFPDGPAAAAEHGTAGHLHEHAERVQLSPQAQDNLKLAVAPLVPGPYWRTVLIPGSVVDRPGQSDRGVTARVAGVVTAVTVQPGDTVRGGEPLFTIQLASEFLQSAQTDLIRTVRELQLATDKRDRVAALVKTGANPAADLTDADNQVKRFDIQARAVRRQLQVFGLTAGQVAAVEAGDVVTSVTVTAPAHSPEATGGDPPTAADPAALARPVYEVQELKAHLGEQVQAGQTLCLLADHRKLYVEGQAFKSEAKALARAAELRVPVAAEFADEAPGDWPPQPPLLVHHLSNQVDPATRTFAVYLPLDNQPTTFDRDGRTMFVWRYRPGQRVRLRVPVEKLGDDVFVLPAGAVVREGADAFVFVQDGNSFERKPVRVLSEDRTDVVVANDGSVAAGDLVVRTQAAAVNRALKAAQGGEHGHDHEH